MGNLNDDSISGAASNGTAVHSEKLVNSKHVILLSVVVAVLLVLTGCSRSDEARPLTQQEAELLAVARYKVYQLGQASFDVRFAGDPDVWGNITLDTQKHTAFGASSLEEEISETSGAWAWNLNRIYTNQEGMASALNPDLWFGREMDQQNTLDIFLALVVQMSSDRPENPQLLMQNGATFLRRDSISGVDCIVIAGPRPARSNVDNQDGESRVRYWVGEDGMLLRLEAYVDSSSQEWSSATYVSDGDVYAVPEFLEVQLSL